MGLAIIDIRATLRVLPTYRIFLVAGEKPGNVEGEDERRHLCTLVPAVVGSAGFESGSEDVVSDLSLRDEGLVHRRDQVVRPASCECRQSADTS